MAKKPTKEQAIRQLWEMGELSWKLKGKQKDVYEYLKNDPYDISCVLISRQWGKSWTLLTLSIEECVKNPNTIVKYVCPKQKMVERILKPRVKELIQDCPEDMKPEWKTQEKIWLFPNGSEIQVAGADNGNYDNIRGGCFAGEMPIMTPTGPVPIKDINVGDFIYGYNEDGTTSITRVKNKFNNGKKEVFKISNKLGYIGEATADHKWLTLNKCQYFRGKNTTREKATSELNPRDYIVRRLPKIPCGEVAEPHAYVIGAFIGDGCRKVIGNTLDFSSKEHFVPCHIADTLNCYAIRGKDSDKYNAHWKFSSNDILYKHSEKITFNYYTEWIYGKDFTQKNFDYDIVDTWNRESCLKLLAGLIDSDGSVQLLKNCLEVCYNSSNLELLQNIKKLIFKLFQYEAKIMQDKRDIYTSPHYRLRIRSSFSSIRILDEISPFLQSEHKKIKDHYYDIPYDEKPDVYHVNIGESRITDVYDLEVDNATHLYLTGHGLVTHNSAHLCIVDEAGFCDELETVVYSVLAPTTDTTDGRILLASTPNDKDPNHDFHEFFVFPMEAEGRLVKYTVYDSPMLDENKIQKIINRYPGGENNPKFRCEYLVEIPRSSELTVVPEFNGTIKANTITEDVIIPPFYDAYVSMDVGFKDLTVALFGYYDFREGKLIILDELVMNGPEMTTDRLAEEIRHKEELRFYDEKFEESKAPFLRVMDNDLKLINDLSRLHDLYFIPTAKDNKEAAINTLRMWIHQERIIIHPRCIHLIYHLENGQWDKNRKKFKHLKDSPSGNIRGGHADALDSLIYLVRNVMESKNPYPSNYGRLAGPNVVDTGLARKQDGKGMVDLMRSILNLKNK